APRHGRDGRVHHGGARASAAASRLLDVRRRPVPLLERRGTRRDRRWPARAGHRHARPRRGLPGGAARPGDARAARPRDAARRPCGRGRRRGGVAVAPRGAACAPRPRRRTRRPAPGAPVTLGMGVALLAVGTLAIRLAGTLLRSRFEPTPAVLLLV